MEFAISYPCISPARANVLKISRYSVPGGISSRCKASPLSITPAIVRLWQPRFVSTVCEGSETRWKPDPGQMVSTWKTIEEPDTSARASKHRDQRQNTFGEDYGANQAETRKFGTGNRPNHVWRKRIRMDDRRGNIVPSTRCLRCGWIQLRGYGRRLFQ